MKKTNKITSITGAGTWDSQYGTMYRFEIEMENGDVGQALTKKEDQDTYIIGDTIEYEFTDGKFPKIKRVYEKPNGVPSNDTVQNLIVRQVAFKCSVDLIISKGGDVSNIMDYTDIFTDFILTGKKPELKEQEMSF